MLNKLGKFLLPIGGLKKNSFLTRGNPTHDYKMRLLHPVSLIVIIFMFIIAPFVCMFTRDKIFEVWEQLKSDIAIW